MNEILIPNYVGENKVSRGAQDSNRKPMMLD